MVTEVNSALREKVKLPVKIFAILATVLFWTVSIFNCYEMRPNEPIRNTYFLKVVNWLE